MPFAVSQGVPIHFIDTGGSGEVVILVAGLGAGTDAWPTLWEKISAKQRCIAIDNRGIGESGHTGWHKVQDLAQDVIAVMDKAEVLQAHVIGNSMGGMIAQTLAAECPERVLSLTLISSSPGILSVPMHPNFFYSLLRAACSKGDKRQRFLAQLVMAQRPSHFTLKEFHSIIDAESFTPPFNSPAILKQIYAAARFGGLWQLTQVRVPSLIIHGRMDRVVPPTNARIMARLLPGAGLHILEGAGHFILTDAGEKVARRTLSFVAAPREYLARLTLANAAQLALRTG